MIRLHVLWEPASAVERQDVACVHTALKSYNYFNYRALCLGKVNCHLNVRANAILHFYICVVSMKGMAVVWLSSYGWNTDLSK